MIKYRSPRADQEDASLSPIPPKYKGGVVGKKGLCVLAQYASFGLCSSQSSWDIGLGRQ